MLFVGFINTVKGAYITRLQTSGL